MRINSLDVVGDKSPMLTCPFTACPYFWHKWVQRSGENKVEDDDRQSRAFIFLLSGEVSA